MTNWTEVYRPVLGQEIAGLVWMPITADTPQVASELQMASCSFSGAAFVRFSNQASINLSWQQLGDRFALSTGNAAAWVAHSLDRIQAAGDLWIGLVGSTLASVELYTLPDDELRRAVGIKHRTTNGFFWIATGDSGFIGDQDDLWVGVDCDPSNHCDLISLGVVEAEVR